MFDDDDDDFNWNEVYLLFFFSSEYVNECVFQEELKKLEDNATTINNKNNGRIMSNPSTSSRNCSDDHVIRTSIEKHTSPKRVPVKRKFPGPAGLFPDSNQVLNNKNSVETPLLSSVSKYGN